jgi:hypothetical protein
MPSFFRAGFAILTGALFVLPPSYAFNTPLSEQAVREAYFLGQRRDESMYAFLNKYTKLLAPPKTGPHIAAITFFTPFALLVQYSSRQSNYSAQRAARDHKAQDEIVEIQVAIQFTPSYGAMISAPTHSRSGSPTAIEQRSPEFWRAFKYRVFDGDEEITAEDISGEPQYQCSEGGCTLTGAIVYIQFPATAFQSDSAAVEVTPREGDTVSVDFDLSSLR